MFDYNCWDDRIVEEYNNDSNCPCYGCCDFVDGKCISNGGCGNGYRIVKEDLTKWYDEESD